MRTIDLSHLISTNMPVYPGTEPPKMKTACTLSKDSFVEKEITLFTHTGTHLDAPAHIFPDGKTLDSYPVSGFWGRGVVLDFNDFSRSIITENDVLPYADLIRQADFVLLYTGWSKLWGSHTYFEDYPVLSADAARFLADFGLKGVGVDAISVDKVETVDFSVHKTFLAKDTLIIENLTNLELLVGRQFNFYCFPLKISTADGSPVRAVAILDKI
ncbi:cyclase family protein [Dethiobacter alkaliphilus]|uniref:Cyclase family protein n=1 Tax=Dethiobacter alkaliphilus AHT 1 TaxID=555088 RepID=C0GJS7_DETAL|nr:cyclase family protein [Dethiobacter alkaliphilus]EEG76385.1 cyclase family protein [Dethiobacter alkaliphilus AHT 1]